jgi:ABC-type nickel/cobalt efflux system permease component RcnA
MVIAIGLWAIWTRMRRWRVMRAEHDHGHQHPHAHGGNSHTHSHAAPGAPITTRSLIALGVSGGIVPCPSALVVLVAAISQHRLGLGLVLILAFSIGLAATLTAVGLAVLHGGRLIQRLRPERRLFGGRVAGVLPALSATLIVVAGSLITLRAIPQIG